MQFFFDAVCAQIIKAARRRNEAAHFIFLVRKFTHLHDFSDE
jgi:hypothetical protein